MRAFVVAVACGLLLPAAASAHISVSPSLLPSGREVELRVELPGLRPGFAPRGLDVTGSGISTLATELSGRGGEESRWRVRVDVTTTPGPLLLLLVVRYADNRSITVRQTVTVVPPLAGTVTRNGHPVLPWVVGGLAAALLGVAALLVVRRRRQTD